MSEENKIENPIEGLEEALSHTEDTEIEEEQKEDASQVLLREVENLKKELAATRAQVSNVDHTLTEAKQQNIHSQAMRLKQEAEVAYKNGDLSSYDRLNQQRVQLQQISTQSKPARSAALDSFLKSQPFGNKLYNEMTDSEKDLYDNAIIQEKRYRAIHGIAPGVSEEKDTEVYNHINHKLHAMLPQHYAGEQKQNVTSMTHSSVIKKQISTPSFNADTAIRNLEAGEKQAYERHLDMHDKEGAARYLKAVHERKLKERGQK